MRSGKNIWKRNRDKIILRKKEVWVYVHLHLTAKPFRPDEIDDVLKVSDFPDFIFPVEETDV